MLSIYKALNPDINFRLEQDRMAWTFPDGHEGFLILNAGGDWRQEGVNAVWPGQMLVAMMEPVIAERNESMKSLEARNAELREEVKRARLAEATLVVNHFSTWETPPAFELAPLADAVTTRLEYLGPDHDDTIRARWVLGVVSFSQGREAEGLGEMRRAAHDHERAIVRPDIRLVGMCENLIQAELWTGHLEEAEGWLDKLDMAMEDATNDDGTPIAFGLLYSPFDPGYIPRHMIETGGRWASTASFASSFKARIKELQSQGLREAVLEHSSQLSQLTDVDGITSVVTADRLWYRGVVERALALCPDDQRSHRALALSEYRSADFARALPTIMRAMELRAAIPDDPTTTSVESAPHPSDLAILAMTRFRLAEGEPEQGAAHPAAAREALAQVRAILADPVNAEVWAKDYIAFALLAEAEALIDPPPPKP